MRVEKLQALLAAALCAKSTAAAVRYEILNRDAPAPDGIQAANATSKLLTTQLAPRSDIETSVAEASGQSPSVDPTTVPIHDVSSDSTSTLPIPTHITVSVSSSTTSHNTTTSTDIPKPGPSTCEPGATTCDTVTHQPETVTSDTTTTTPTSTSASTPTSTIDYPLTTSESCVSLTFGQTKTYTSIVYTDTTTFYGNASDYTPPFPTISTTTYCNTNRSDNDPNNPGLPNVPNPSKITSWRNPTSTFITTAKGPTVVVRTDPPPDYSSPGGGGNNGGQHTMVPADGPDMRGPDGQPVEGDDGSDGDNGGGSSGGNGDGDGGGNGGGNGAAKPTPKPTFSVTAGSDSVIIGDKTIDDIKPDETRTVTAGGGTFTILPTAVVGEGHTIERPAQAEPVTDFKPSPIMTSIGGLPFSISGSVVEIDGRTLTVPPKGMHTTINGVDVSLGPGAAVVDHSKSFDWPDPTATPEHAIVKGGEMITALGSTILVVNSTTITYGPGIDKTKTTIDDDVLTIGPDGVVFHKTTIGGPSAEASATSEEIVGGATIVQLASKIYDINGHTFTIGKDIDPVTTKIGGELLTIGPKDVSVGTMKLNPEDNAAITSTFEGSGSDNIAKETGGSSGGEDDQEDAATTMRPRLILAGLCAAASLWTLI